MADRASERLIDLSHVIERGMTTHKGLPGPHICDYWAREASAANYDDGATFQIGRIEMVANTGTYVDSPFHRYAEGRDLSELPLESLADLDGLVVRRPFEDGLAVDAEAFAGLDLRGKAVLVHSGWSRLWRTDGYLTDHPFLTEAAARALVEARAAFVGIDSHNIDDTRTRGRPVHTLLLGADIPIGEHMTGFDRLPDQGFRFSAVPPKIKGMGTFPPRLRRASAVKALLGLLLMAGSFTVPPPGSPSRRAILDALRPVVEKRLGPSIEFKVTLVRVQGEWAFVIADPQRRGDKPIDGWRIFGEHFGNMDGLRIEAVLRRQRGRWVVVDHGLGATDVWYCDVGPRSLKADWGC